MHYRLLLTVLALAALASAQLDADHVMNPAQQFVE